MSALYLLSPPAIDDISGFAASLTQALDAGDGHVQAFQLRLKAHDPAQPAAHGKLTQPHAMRDAILTAAEMLRPICHARAVAFILNDTPEFVTEAGADGVHLGQEDGSIKAARALMPEEAVVGISAHASRHLAMEAAEAGADYIAFGAFYPTRSKSPEALAHWGTPTPDILHFWTTYTEIPCVAIGGITPDNCAPLVQAGADFIAVLSYIWQHEQDSAAAVRAMLQAIHSATTQPE